MKSAQEIFGTNEVADRKGHLWLALLAEFIGTMFLNFFGCASVLTFSLVPMDIVRIALSFGFAIFASVQALGHVSGAHLNPAVTIGCLITARVPIIRGILYVIVQCLGCISGSALLKALTPDDYLIQGKLGLPSLHKGLSEIQGFGVELLLGFLLVLVVFGVCDPKRVNIYIPAPLAIGLTVSLGHLAAVPITGAAMNPARALGSAVVANDYAYQWIYWAGPILGGMAAALLYHFLLKAPEEDYSPVKGEEGCK